MKPGTKTIERAASNHLISDPNVRSWHSECRLHRPRLFSQSAAPGSAEEEGFSPQELGWMHGVHAAMTNHPIGRALTKLGEWAAHPAAFALVLVYAAAWLLLDRESFDFHGATELIVLVMTIFIVRSEHRDTQAIHAKLDEILRVQGRGTDEITTLDHREPEEIEQHREESRRA